MAPINSAGSDALILWAAHSKHLADPLGPGFYSQYFEGMKKMRIYRVICTVSVPDGIERDELEEVLGHAIETEADGLTLNQIFTELTDDTLPTPEVPVEVLRNGGEPKIDAPASPARCVSPACSGQGHPITSCIDYHAAREK